jgi:hypothetical protein
LPATVSISSLANGALGEHRRARPPACRAFQIATIFSASAIALRSASARLASAAARAAARSRSCARPVRSDGRSGSTSRRFCVYSQRCTTSAVLSNSRTVRADCSHKSTRTLRLAGQCRPTARTRCRTRGTQRERTLDGRNTGCGHCRCHQYCLQHRHDTQDRSRLLSLGRRSRRVVGIHRRATPPLHSKIRAPQQSG